MEIGNVSGSQLALAIAVEGLGYRYPGASTDAVNEISFVIPRGCVTGILGPNGSGKSTTFRMLSTQLVPSRGEAWIDGVSVRNNPAAARASLGVTFQSPSLDPWLSVEENLEIHGRLFGLSRAEIRSRTTELLKLFGLLARRKERVRTLSGGLARRTELAKTLLSAPQILLLDEPTTGLDPAARVDFWNELRKLRSGGITIVVATHLLEEAELCDELLFFSEGKVVGHGAPDELRAAGGREVLQAEGSGALGIAEKLRPVLGMSDHLHVEPGRMRLETNEGARWFEQIRSLSTMGVDNLRWGKPTLADVYFRLTGREYR